MSTNIHKNCICILCIQMQIQKYKKWDPSPQGCNWKGVQWGCHPIYTKSTHIDLIESHWRRCMEPECNWKPTISFKALSCPGETILFWGGRLSSNVHKRNSQKTNKIIQSLVLSWWKVRGRLACSEWPPRCWNFLLFRFRFDYKFKPGIGWWFLWS